MTVKTKNDLMCTRIYFQGKSIGDFLCKMFVRSRSDVVACCMDIEDMYRLCVCFAHAGLMQFDGVEDIFKGVLKPEEETQQQSGAGQ